MASSLGLVFACVLALAIPLWLASRGVIAEDTLDWLVPSTMLGTFFVGGVLVMAWQFSTPAVAGEPSSPSAVASSPAEVARERRRVRLARIAEERLFATQGRAAPSVDLLIWLFVLVPLVGVAAWFSFEMAAGREPYDPIILLFWLALAAALTLVVGLRARRRHRKRRLAEALHRSFDGRRLASHDHVVAWLNNFWAAPSAHEDLYEGPCHAAAAGRVRGYPVLIDIEPDGYSDDVEIPPRVLVYVAALVGSMPPSGPAWQEHEAAWARAGFVLALVPDAGLLARGQPDVLARARRHPEALADLGLLVNRLVSLAEACAALPPSEHEQPPRG